LKRCHHRLTHGENTDASHRTLTLIYCLISVIYPQTLTRQPTRPAGGGPADSGGAAPSEAEVGAGLRAFQDQVGLVEDGRASPRGPTESELSKAVDRATVLADRPPRTGPIRFGTLMANNYRESRSMAQGVRRRSDHRAAVELMRRAMEDDPGGAFPEIVQLAEQVDVLNLDRGARFRADLVKMIAEVQPALAPHLAAGRVPEETIMHADTTLRLPADGGAKTGKSGGDRRAAPARNPASKAVAGGDMAEMFRRTVAPTVADRTQTAQYDMARSTGGPDEGLIRKGFDPSLSEAERETLQGARDRASWILLGSHFVGRTLARENYVHYLRASGEDRVWSRERMREIGPFREAEIANRTAFPAKIVEGWKPGLLGLKEGERIRLSRVIVTNRFPSPKNELRDSILQAGFDTTSCWLSAASTSTRSAR
jgi:hypothetical protein